MRKSRTMHFEMPTEAARKVWLAGVGAFSKARDECNKVFQALVREGRSIQLRTRAMAEESIGEVAGRVTEVREKATESWDKLEQVFEDRPRQSQACFVVAAVPGQLGQEQLARGSASGICPAR